MYEIVKKVIIIFLFIALWQASWKAIALEVDDLKFVSGDDIVNYSLEGKPHATYSVSDTLPADVLSNVYSLLPEGSEINPDFIAADKSSSIAIDGDLNGAAYAEVSITFLNEGAGYRNSFGYFIYETDNPPLTKDEIVEHLVIFPNASKPNAGTMVEGDTLDLNVQVSPGHTISFFIIPNGWGYSGSYNNIASLGSWNTPFYSLPELNPESTEINRRHSVAFVDTVNEFLIIGFEDIFRPYGDNDFNDILFTANVTPFMAIDGVNPDGSTNGNYEVLIQNNNPEVSMTTIFPAADSWGTIAFEDNWPVKGDYDFNDVVMRYRFTEILNGQRELKKVNAVFQLQAMGADYHNGFALRLPNVDVSNIENVSLTNNGVDVEFDIVEQGSNEVVLIISPDTHIDVINAGQLSNACKYYRVTSACIDIQTGDIEYALSIDFVSPVPRSTIGQPPYDPFIFAAAGTYHGEYGVIHPGRTWESHLKQFSGTSVFDAGLLNAGADKSDGSNYFITANAFPWVINLTDSWVHPREGTDISRAYKKFRTWVTSAGANDVDWHILNNAELNKIAQ